MISIIQKIDNLIAQIEKLNECNDELIDRMKGYEIAFDELDQRLTRIEEHLGEEIGEIEIDSDFGGFDA